MSNTLISITSILLILIAPAYCGTLFAQGFNKGQGGTGPHPFWNIIPDPFSWTEETDHIGNGYSSTEIVYDCINMKMYNAIHAALGGSTRYYLVEVTPTTGVPIDANPLTPSTQVTERLEALEFVNGILYGYSSTVRGLVTVDLATTPPTITPITSGLAMDPLGAMAYDVCTDTMYGATSLSDTASNLVIMDLERGLPIFIPNANTGVNYFGGLAFDDDCLLWGVTAGGDRGDIVNIDLDDIENPVPRDAFPTIGPNGGIIGLVNVQASGCQSKTPTAVPTTAPTIPTTSPTQATATPTTSPTTDSSSISSSSSSSSSDDDDDDDDSD